MIKVQSTDHTFTITEKPDKSGHLSKIRVKDDITYITGYGYMDAFRPYLLIVYVITWDPNNLQLRLLIIDSETRQRLYDIDRYDPQFSIQMDFRPTQKERIFDMLSGRYYESISY